MRPCSSIPFAMLLAFLAAGCQKKPVKVSSEAAPAPAVGETFRITVASGGGFTGAYSGCTLDADGTITLWQRVAGGPDSVKKKTRGSAEQILAFKRRLSAGGSLPAAYGETGNMTTLVTLELADTAHTWSWPGTGAEAKNAPAAFQGWYPEVRAYCRQLEEGGGAAGPKP